MQQQLQMVNFMKNTALFGGRSCSSTRGTSSRARRASRSPTRCSAAGSAEGSCPRVRPRAPASLGEPGMRRRRPAGAAGASRTLRVAPRVALAWPPSSRGRRRRSRSRSRSSTRTPTAEVIFSRNSVRATRCSSATSRLVQNEITSVVPSSVLLSIKSPSNPSICRSQGSISSPAIVATSIGSSGDVLVFVTVTCTAVS